jgi:hypothetical protein
MLPWKQRGTGKSAKGINLRDMLSRLTRTEADAKRDASDERQGEVAPDPDDHETSSSQRGDAATLLSRYFSSNGFSSNRDSAPSQVGPFTWNTPHQDEVPAQDAIGPIARSYAHMQWAEAQRNNEQSSMESPEFGVPPAHSAQFADEIVSGIARKLAARQYVPKFDVAAAFPEELTREPPTSHAYTHGFEPAPQEHVEEDFTPPVSQARPLEKSNRSRAIANFPAAEDAPPSSMRRIAFATAGGFSVALATMAGFMMMNRAPAPQEPPKSDRVANVRPNTPLPAERIETVVATTPAVETVLPAPPAARPAPSVPPASTFIASLATVPPANPAARKPMPTLNVGDIAVPAGSADAAFPVSLDSGGGSSNNLKIVVTELPGGVSFNRGQRARDGSWNLRPQDLEGLRIIIPAAMSPSQITVALVSEGIQVARLNPTISIETATDLKVSLGKNDNEEKARGLFEKGEARLGNGDVIGARMFFKKAADAGDAQAANAMGATYDPDLFSSMRVQGMRPDVEMARQWYRRAMELGSKDSLERLERLKSR